MVPTQRNPWITSRHSMGKPRVRLICVPQAGGAAGAFSSWRSHLPADVELAQVELPGRGTRRRESLSAPDLEGLAAEIFEALLPELDLPYVLFGHSMGGSLVYEVARLIQRSDAAPPLAAVFSGARAPQTPCLLELSTADDASLFAWMYSIGGLPDELLASSWFRQEAVRSVRRDLEYVDPYLVSQPTPLDCPVHVFVGADDTVTPPEHRNHWRAVAAGSFTTTVMPGQHNFPYRDPAAMVAAVMRSVPDLRSTQG
ncbi:thioesterase II family protein [Streptomyces sp. NPDC059651]|uniref:thioesterase II family protein n=1 Tax=Streptomyces sp. NPDC059651 TaxID=3346897 RepID=UPI0036C50CBB